MAEKLLKRLATFNAEKKFQGKGPLCVALVVTRHARQGLPLDPAKLRTRGGGQVYGPGKHAAVDELVKKYNEIVTSVETNPSLQIEFRK